MAKPQLGPLRILLVNGGGLLTHIGLKVIHSLEQECNRPAKELFDLFSGISFGSLFSSLFLQEPISSKQIYDLAYVFLQSMKKAEQKRNLFGLRGPKYCDQVKWNGLFTLFGHTRFEDLPHRLLIPVWEEQKKNIRIYDNRTDKAYLCDLIHRASSLFTYFGEIQGRIESEPLESDLSFATAEPILFVLTHLFVEIQQRGAIIVELCKPEEIKKTRDPHLLQKGFLFTHQEILEEQYYARSHFHQEILAHLSRSISVEYYRLSPYFRGGPLAVFELPKARYDSLVDESCWLLRNDIQQIASRLEKI